LSREVIHWNSIPPTFILFTLARYNYNISHGRFSIWRRDSICCWWSHKHHQGSGWGCNRRQCLPAQQGEPVDLKCCRTMPQPTHKTWETLQIHCDMCDHAEEWRRATHSQLMLLGQLLWRKLHCKVGEQDYVLHCQCVWSGHLRDTISPSPPLPLTSTANVYRYICSYTFVY